METILHSPKLIRIDEDVRSSKDRRRRFDVHLYEYVDDAGDIYRKGFEVDCGEIFDAPKSGTHKQLNALKYQLR
jgi:hypothetical protein